MVGHMMRPPMATGRTSINFTGPAGMKVTWQLPDGSFNDEAGALTAPKEYNFLQGQVYRLRLGSILPDFPGKYFYPTLEVAPASPKTLTFLAHSSVPITFTPDDFAQARAGNLVVKVIYLPDPLNQDFSTVVAAEEVVTTRLPPGAGSGWWTMRGLPDRRSARWSNASQPGFRPAGARRSTPSSTRTSPPR